MTDTSTRRLLTIGVLSAVCCLTPAIALAQKLVYVIRHAERADGGVVPAGMTTPADPELSAEGEARAKKIAVMLADAGIKAIFTTEYKRTKNTAAPLATRLGVASQVVTSKDTPGLIERLRKEHANDIVLVIGHSNSMPEIIKALGGGVVTVADDDYTSMFVVVPGAGTTTRIRY